MQGQAEHLGYDWNFLVQPSNQVAAHETKIQITEAARYATIAEKPYASAFPEKLLEGDPDYCAE